MKKYLALILAVMMVMTMFAACGGNGGETTGAANAGTNGGTSDVAPVKIGLTGPFSGGASVYGLAVRAGMEIAVEEINAKADAEGGLKIEFKSYDDEHDGEKALAAYNQLKDWGMQMFAGAVTTGPSNAIAPDAASDRMFMMTPSASAEEVAMAGSNVLQMCFTDPNQGINAAQVIFDKKLGEKIGIIYDSSDAYSTGIRDGFMTKAKELGLNIVVDDAAFTSDTKGTISNLVDNCKNAGCDLVFLPFYAAEAVTVLQSAAASNYDAVFFGCDGMDGILSTDNFDTTMAEGLYMLTPLNPFDPDENVQAFVQKYKDKVGDQEAIPNQFVADGYDVIYALYEACVAQGVTGDTSVEDTCTKLEEYFATASFNGMTGSNLQWDENGMVSKNPEAVVIEDGKYVAVK